MSPVAVSLLAVTVDETASAFSAPTHNASNSFQARASFGLTQLAGTAGCVSETGSAGACGDGVALSGLRGVEVSPDGQDVYTTALSGDAVAVFRREGTTGRLTQWSGTRACISETGTAGACADGRGLDGARDPKITSDGKDLYVMSGSAAAANGSVAVLPRSR